MRFLYVARGAAAVVLVAAAGCASKTIEPKTTPSTARSPAAPVVAGEPSSRSMPEPSVESDSPVFASEHLDRATLVDAVLRRNPSLAAARAAWEAARARPIQVATLDDPMIGYGIAPLSIGSSKVDFGEQADISQRLPWPGKLRSKGDAARGEAEARWHDYEAAKLDLALAAVDLLDDYYVTARALEINDDHVRLLRDFKSSATSLYSAGVLSQQDPLQAEVELAHLEHREVELVTQRRVIVARLNALLRRAPGAALPPPPRTLSLAETWEPSVALSDETAVRLEDSAVAVHPAVTAAAAEIRARQAEVRLAGLEAYPDFGVTGSYNSMWAENPHRWMVGFNLNVPLWRNRIDAARSEARARVLEAEAVRRAVEDEVRSRVRETFEELREAHHVLMLYRSRLLPAGRDQVRAAHAGVDTGTNSFLALIMAERNLRDVELGYEEAIATVDRRLAELARAVGRLPDDSADFFREIAGGQVPAASETKEGELP